MQESKCRIIYSATSSLPVYTYLARNNLVLKSDFHLFPFIPVVSLSWNRRKYNNRGDRGRPTLIRTDWPVFHAETRTPDRNFSSSTFPGTCERKRDPRSKRYSRKRPVVRDVYFDSRLHVKSPSLSAPCDFIPDRIHTPRILLLTRTRGPCSCAENETFCGENSDLGDFPRNYFAAAPVIVNVLAVFTEGK